MSYESSMLSELKMPPRSEVEFALLQALFKHNGVIKEFGAGEEIVQEIAVFFGLSEKQRKAYLETIYKKQNRKKRSSLWHRLLFRAADSLAKDKLVSRPTNTFHITQKREWMLTEKGFDKVLKILKIPISQKDFLPTQSYEVQKIIKKLEKAPRPANYVPFDEGKKVIQVTKELTLRQRGFRQLVIDAYSYQCAVCGVKIKSPDSLSWEVEAAHIVPHGFKGKDDILNGLALCHIHHWAFDVGWFTLSDDYRIQVSEQINILPKDFGRMGRYEILRGLNNNNKRIFLPSKEEIFPHQNSIRWHRENIFHAEEKLPF